MNRRTMLQSVVAVLSSFPFVENVFAQPDDCWEGVSWITKKKAKWMHDNVLMFLGAPTVKIPLTGEQVNFSMINAAVDIENIQPDLDADTKLKLWCIGSIAHAKHHLWLNAYNPILKDLQAPSCGESASFKISRLGPERVGGVGRYYEDYIHAWEDYRYMLKEGEPLWYIHGAGVGE